MKRRLLISVSSMFTRWTVVAVFNSCALCECICGNRSVIAKAALIDGRSRSCGCLRRHGGLKTAEYNSWTNMISRCYNPENPHYGDYGGRGISVCPAWKGSFASFLVGVGPRPGEGYSIDRINNDGDYEPGNVRWATRREQNRNKRSNRLVLYMGEATTYTEIAERVGLKAETLRHRLNAGWPIERALSQSPACGRWAHQQKGAAA